MSVDYNKTLNLPKTDFPMRAALAKREPAMLEQWNAFQVYEKMIAKNEGKPRFILHDGPPFSNGLIHMGTALNKCLKDFIVRYKNMSGFQAPYIPGWDNHGMPIESAIIKQNKLDRKSMTIPEFRDACRDFAAGFIDKQRDQFKRLGGLGEWDQPYVTMDPAFEAIEVSIFGDMFEKGYIYKGKRPVYWCAHDETALAEAEIEYDDHQVESLYVKFRVKDDKGLFAPYADKENIYFVIWTTTTWTLPGNLAICLGADFTYVLAKAANGEVYVLAKDLMETVATAAALDSLEILAEFKGSELEFMTAQHPLFDRESLVIHGEHVTLEAGTGCVHTAPGHGVEDFEICRRYDANKGTHIGVIVPVDDRGHMTDEAGVYSGLYYAKANKAIQADLTESGALLASKTINHQYAHCWRCKNPILYRATDQWFCSVEAFKEEAIAACKDVSWLPTWGYERMTSMIRERADWCISRQRHWGLPIPVLYCESCQETICTPDTIQKISGLFQTHGSNAWYTMTAQEILPEGYVCPKCGGTHFYKLNDTLDCWFDSGSTYAAALERMSPGDYPASLYLEGADQYRGWFQSSLLTSVATRGRAPYEMVLTHGWTVDGNGKAMHKSLGNGVDPADIISKYGADILRLWASASDYHADVRCSDSIFGQLSDIYLKIRNTARFILGNLDGFQPDHMVAYDDMLPMDRYALYRLNRLVERVISGYEKYEFHIAVHAVHQFCVVEMSNLYLDIIKDRLYCEAPDSLKRRSGQAAMYYILDSIVRLVAPILAFTSNEIWMAMPHHAGADAQHIMLNDMPKVQSAWELSSEEAFFWSQSLKLRDDVNKALEAARGEKRIGKSLEAEITIFVSDAAKEAFQVIADQDFETLFIASNVQVVYADGDGYACENFPGIAISVTASEKPRCVRCWTHTSTVGTSDTHPELCARCVDAIS